MSDKYQQEDRLNRLDKLTSDYERSIQRRKKIDDMKGASESDNG